MIRMRMAILAITRGRIGGTGTTIAGMIGKDPDWD
jgi:hypothetical protein